MITDRVIPEHMKNRIRVLVVEDNVLNQKLAGFMLKAWGFHFEIAANGKEAIEKLKDHQFDLVLMDVEMPEMNGCDATVHIRNQMKLGLPIIATTAHQDDKEREKCMSLGMNDYITKPIKEEELYNVVTNYLFSTVVENIENRAPHS